MVLVRLLSYSLLVELLLGMAMPKCFAFKPGYYQGWQDGAEPEYIELYKLEQSADLVLLLKSLDNLDVVGGPVPSLRSCTRDLLRQTLQAEVRKDVAFVWIDDRNVHRPGLDNLALSKLFHFLKELGYKRILFLHGYSYRNSEAAVVFDSAECDARLVDGSYLDLPDKVSNALDAFDYEAAFRACEWIGECEYLGYSRETKIDYEHPPVTRYHIVEFLKGPPMGGVPKIHYEFRCRPEEQAPSGWKFNEDKMPRKNSRWLIFIPSCVPEHGAFKTYHGCTGRLKSTEETRRRLNAVLEKHRHK